MNTEDQIVFGGSVKALGDGKYEAPLVTFGTADRPDLAADFFTKETNFWTEFPREVPLLYSHGLDATLKATRLGVGGNTTLEMKDSGVWMGGQLNLANEYEKAIYGLIEQKKMGTSSGSAPHLVERVADGKAFKVLSWPIVEASLTPQPCESANYGRVVSVKSLPELLGLKVASDSPLARTAATPQSVEADAETALTAVKALQQQLAALPLSAVKGGLSPMLRSKIGSVSDGLLDLLGMVTADDRDALAAEAAILRAVTSEANDLYYDALYGWD